MRTLFPTFNEMASLMAPTRRALKRYNTRSTAHSSWLLPTSNSVSQRLPK